MTPEKSVQSRIDEVLLAEQEGWSKRERSGKWSPSSFGKCYLAQFWNRKNEPKTNPIDARGLRVFKAGKLFHGYIQNTFKELYPEAEIEKIVETDDIFGFCDLALPNETVEIKSQHSRAFWYLHKPGVDIVTEKAGDVLQNTCYAIELKKEYIRLVYISKDDLCVEEYVIRVTDDLRAKYEDELIILRKFWEKNELPPPAPRLYGVDKKGNPKECEYCAWKNKCFEMQGKPITTGGSDEGNGKD